LELVEQVKQLLHQPAILGSQRLGAELEALAQHATGDQQPALLANRGDRVRAQREPLGLSGGLHLGHRPPEVARPKKAG
jgi:hypothetical protein